MNDVLRIARLKIALQRAIIGRAILIFTLEATRVGFHVFWKDINPLDLDAPNASAATHIYLFSDRPAPSRQTKGGGPLFDQPLS